MNIVTVHDVFRAAVFRLPDLEESIGPWLHALLGPPLTRLGHTVRRFSSRDDLPAAVERHGWNRDPSTWTWLFSSPEALPAVAELLAPLRAADLIVGFELTPNIIRFLTTAGLRFVEITQDSIRFCPDLFFRVRTNDPAITTRLARWEVPDAAVRTEADRLRSKLPAAYDGPAATLFVGQVDINSSLIADAALTRVDRFIPELEQTLEGRRLLLKPHPMAPKSGDLLSLYEHFPNARFIAGNIYALLASPAIERVVTLSSSVAAEAPMFDKPVRQLITPDIHTIPGAMASRFHRVDARATSIAFWGDLLDGMPSFMFLDAPPPPLRQRFSVSWGYGREMIAPVSRRIAENEVVSFARGGRGRDLCLFGWSDPEPWGVWSDGGVALLQFDPPADLGSGVAEIVLAPFVPDFRSSAVADRRRARIARHHGDLSFRCRDDDQRADRRDHRGGRTVVSLLGQSEPAAIRHRR